jgi:hypothetical protein
MKGNAGMDDNYARQAEQVRALFLEKDWSEVVQRHDFRFDARYLYIPFLGLTLRIDRDCGMIDYGVGKEYGDRHAFAHNPNNDLPMVVFDYLCPPSMVCALSGQWMPMQHFGFSFHSDAFETANGMFAKRAAFLDEHMEQVAVAIKSIGGLEMPVGDLSFDLQLIGELHVWIQFWRGDEEFPSKLTLLWDAEAQRYMHYETMYYAANLLFSRIEALVGAAPPI